VHAYTDCSPGFIELEAEVTASHLYITVLDTGRGLESQSASPGLGLGFAIIKQKCEALDIRGRPGGGLAVRMVFALG
jgi:anti-sigma regulatory factor (Ser/Thr protein kinase)